MKVAIIYFGASSLLEINYLNHKEFIFDYLNNSNIISMFFILYQQNVFIKMPTLVTLLHLLKMLIKK